MLKPLKEVAVPLEKTLSTGLVKELAEFEKLLLECDQAESRTLQEFELAVKVLPSGKRVYCPNRQSPVRNRKHLVRSLLVH